MECFQRQRVHRLLFIVTCNERSSLEAPKWDSIGGSMPWPSLFMDTRSYGSSTPDWFAVQVWSGREYIAAAHLRQRVPVVFLPCYWDRRRWSDRIKVVERALFAGYLFCKSDRDVVVRIVTTPGVIRVVGNMHGPLPIPAHEVEAIQRIVETRLPTEPSPTPLVGQLVRIERGPLSGVQGIVRAQRNQHRLVVSIPLLQRAVAVEIESDWARLA